MSLTLMSKANESQLTAISKPRVPRSSHMAAKTNKKRNVSLPGIKTTGKERYKNCGTQRKRNESPEYNRKHGHKQNHFEACVWPRRKMRLIRVKHLQESHDSSVSQTLISYIESCVYRLLAGLAFFVNTISWKPCFNVSQTQERLVMYSTLYNDVNATRAVIGRCP